ncbi:MAG: pseudouridine synthase [Putridiphycobacter sp.]
MGRNSQNSNGKGRGRGKHKDVAKGKSTKPKFYNSEEKKKTPRKGDAIPTFDENIRLNKYLANAGICSRREADVMIQTGLVEINGKLVTEMGYKVKPTDEVKYDGQIISHQKKRYVLLNKPKDFVSTNTDGLGRKSIYQLVHKACKEPIIPADRLARYETGLVLFTNDSDLIKKLNHPKHLKKQLFHVEVNKNINTDDFRRLTEGVELSDGGFVKVENIEFIKEGNPRQVGVEIKTNKYKIIERMFEQVGYHVVKSDRVLFGPLSKKGILRGNYRHLTETEIGFLKM